MNRNVIFWKSLLMTLKVWNYGFTVIFIWMMLAFCMMFWNLNIQVSFCLSAVICISVFTADWFRCFKKIKNGLNQLD